jgi:hypothetical protein
MYAAAIAGQNSPTLLEARNPTIRHIISFNNNMMRWIYHPLPQWRSFSNPEVR